MWVNMKFVSKRKKINDFFFFSFTGSEDSSGSVGQNPSRRNRKLQEQNEKTGGITQRIHVGQRANKRLKKIGGGNE